MNKMSCREADCYRAKRDRISFLMQLVATKFIYLPEYPTSTYFHDGCYGYLLEIYKRLSTSPSSKASLSRGSPQTLVVTENSSSATPWGAPLWNSVFPAISTTTAPKIVH